MSSSKEMTKLAMVNNRVGPKAKKVGKFLDAMTQILPLVDIIGQDAVDGLMSFYKSSMKDSLESEIKTVTEESDGVSDAAEAESNKTVGKLNPTIIDSSGDVGPIQPPPSTFTATSQSKLSKIPDMLQKFNDITGVLNRLS